MARKESEFTANEAWHASAVRAPAVLQAGEAFTTPGPKRTYAAPRVSLVRRIARFLGL